MELHICFSRHKEKKNSPKINILFSRDAPQTLQEFRKDKPLSTSKSLVGLQTILKCQNLRGICTYCSSYSIYKESGVTLHQISNPINLIHSLVHVLRLWSWPVSFSFFLEIIAHISLESSHRENI